MRHHNYPPDPRWIMARFPSVCTCGHHIKEGETIYYYPASHKAVCLDCGRKGAAMMEDELQHDLKYEGKLR